MEKGGIPTKVGKVASPNDYTVKKMSCISYTDLIY